MLNFVPDHVLRSIGIAWSGWETIFFEASACGLSMQTLLLFTSEAERNDRERSQKPRRDRGHSLLSSQANLLLKQSRQMHHARPLLHPGVFPQS